MALEAHLQTLNRRHQELEADLASEMKHAAMDEERMHELKRLKLRIKDQITELRNGRRPPT